MKRETIENVYMFDTRVENIFINEHLVSATGEQIKVFLMGLMYADIGRTITDEELAQALSLELWVVRDAWNYWIKKKVVKRSDKGIEFFNLKEKIYGDKKDSVASKEKQTPMSYEDIMKENKVHPLENTYLVGVFQGVEKAIGRPINHMEREAIIDLVDIVNATKEVIVYGFKYCFQREKKNANYIRKVIQEWVLKGYKTAEDIENELVNKDQRYHIYKRIMRALGFPRMATEGEKKVIDSWVDSGITIDIILDACNKTTGISNPNINYVNSIITRIMEEKEGKTSGKDKISRKQILEYVELLRDQEETEARQRIDEVESKIPEIKAFREQIRKNIIGMALVKGDANEKVEKMKVIKDENRKISENINRLLHKHNIPVDYMEVKYRCNICKDTVILDDGSQCKCFIERERELKEKNS